MNAEDLAFVADALLALCDQSPGAPFYSRSNFDHKLRRNPRRLSLFAQLAGKGGEDQLLESECEEILGAARLTERQADVMSHRLEGWTFEEIGDLMGHTKQAAQRVFVQALKKIRVAFSVYPYTGLSDVYRRETRRGSRSGGFGRI